MSPLALARKKTARHWFPEWGLSESGVFMQEYELEPSHGPDDEMWVMSRATSAPLTEARRNLTWLRRAKRPRRTHVTITLEVRQNLQERHPQCKIDTSLAVDAE